MSSQVQRVLSLWGLGKIRPHYAETWRTPGYNGRGTKNNVENPSFVCFSPPSWNIIFVKLDHFDPGEKIFKQIFEIAYCRQLSLVEKPTFFKRCRLLLGVDCSTSSRLLSSCSAWPFPQPWPNRHMLSLKNWKPRRITDAPGASNNPDTQLKHAEAFTSNQPTDPYAQSEEKQKHTPPVY